MRKKNRRHYNEQKNDGHGKRSDEDYCKEMKERSGASPAEVYPHYEQALMSSSHRMTR